MDKEKVKNLKVMLSDLMSRSKGLRSIFDFDKKKYD